MSRFHGSGSMDPDPWIRIHGSDGSMEPWIRIHGSMDPDPWIRNLKMHEHDFLKLVNLLKLKKFCFQNMSARKASRIKIFLEKFQKRVLTRNVSKIHGSHGSGTVDLEPSKKIHETWIWNRGSGSMDLMDPKDPWIHGSDPWIHGSISPWIHVSMAPLDPLTSILRDIVF